MKMSESSRSSHSAKSEAVSAENDDELRRDDDSPDESGEELQNEERPSEGTQNCHDAPGEEKYLLITRPDRGESDDEERIGPSF